MSILFFPVLSVPGQRRDLLPAFGMMALGCYQERAFTNESSRSPGGTEAPSSPEGARVGSSTPRQCYEGVVRGKPQGLGLMVALTAW